MRRKVDFARIAGAIRSRRPGGRRSRMSGDHVLRAHIAQPSAASRETFPEAARQDRDVRLELALIGTVLTKTAAALRKILKTKLKSDLKTLVNDCLIQLHIQCFFK